jgi:tetratricopeptide (TPR) repeat protein
MSAPARTRAIVVVVALVAAAVVAGVVYATRQDPAQPKALCKKRPAVQEVAGVSSPYLGAVRTAFEKSPASAARALEGLANEHPKDPVVQFNEATALLCAGYVVEATQGYRRAKKAGRNTYYEVKADNFLHPQFFDQGYPILQYLGDDSLLIQGQLEQRRFHQHSAERLYAKAARLHPDDADAQVAAAIGRFDMDNLGASFSRLGPLVNRFPRSQTVRFHLGLLLAWTGQRTLAVKEFKAARELGARTPLGKDADAFLVRLGSSGTQSSKR